jgi:enamine deaminase RidA (YjgF/YER057c/UK114 family)
MGPCVVVAADGLVQTTFMGSSGDSEHYIAVDAPSDLSLARQLDHISQRYAEALQTAHLAPDSAVFRRLFVSDAANQMDLVRGSSLFEEPLESPVAVSVVEQPPLPDAKVAMLAYHIDGGKPLTKQRVSPDHVLVKRNGLGHLWTTGLCAGGTKEPSSCADQTTGIFERLVDELGRNGATLAGNCVRTWIYVKDVDLLYQDMVAARTALFDRQGLTQKTHYIASTGIEGACGHRYDSVLMDAYSVLGLDQRQVQYLCAHDRLCDTSLYNVTFERGTRISYADRAHLFISGTASIDASGKVVHVGDVRRQLEWTLDNVDALLRSGGATLADMTHFIVYLRDASDYPAIAAHFEERFPSVPRIIVQGRVCRPEWLVEVEGIAAVPCNMPALPSF